MPNWLQYVNNPFALAAFIFWVLAFVALRRFRPGTKESRSTFAVLLGVGVVLAITGLRQERGAPASTATTHGDNSPAIVAGGNVTYHGSSIPEAAIHRLLKELDKKDLDIAERDAAIADWIAKHDALEKQLASRENDDVAKAAREKFRSGDLEGTAELLKQSLRSNLEEVERGERARESASVNACELSTLSLLQFDYPQALAFAEQAVELAPDNTDYLRDLGSLQESLGMFQEAAKTYARAFELDETAAPSREQAEKLSENYTRLGNHASTMSEYGKAYAYHEKALEMDLELHGEISRPVAIDYNNLGIAAQGIGDPQQALALHQRSLQIKKTLRLGPADLASSFGSLGNSLMWVNRHDEAAAAHQQSLELNRRQFGDRHPEVAKNYVNLGWVRYEQGQYATAQSSFEKALSIVRSLFGDNHYDLARIYKNLALARAAQRDFGAAAELQYKSLAILTEHLATDHPAVTTNLMDLAKSLDELERCCEAVGAWRKAVEILERRFGSSHHSLRASQDGAPLVRCKGRLNDESTDDCFRFPSIETGITPQATSPVADRP